MGPVRDGAVDDGRFEEAREGGTNGVCSLGVGDLTGDCGADPHQLLERFGLDVGELRPALDLGLLGPQPADLGGGGVALGLELDVRRRVVAPGPSPTLASPTGHLRHRTCR